MRARRAKSVERGAGRRVRLAWMATFLAGISALLAFPLAPAQAAEVAPAQAAEVPGTRSGEISTSDERLSATEASEPQGLQVVVHERGRVSQSVDASGSTSSNSSLTVQKPSGGTLRRATLFVASTGFSGPAQGSVMLDGDEVGLGDGVPSYIGSMNYMADVTALVRAKVDAAPPGIVPFDVTETASASIDGVILSLIFDDPGTISDRSIALLFGATQTAGDEFSLQMSQPLDPSSPESVLEMSLGISFGYQSGPTGQYSSVDVNGSRLTSSAGGQDDGESANGALITAGGVGDSRANPIDPNSAPSDPRDDDELYDLTPFVSSGDTEITITTSNPSNDDNILFASFTTNPPVSAVVTPNPAGDGTWVAMGDSFSSGEGADWFHPDTNTDANGCRRSDAYASIANAGLETPYDPDHFLFVACSGARIPDFMSRAQYPNSPAGIHGGKPQIEYLREVGPRAAVVTLTMGGNDMGFSNVIEACAGSAILFHSGQNATYDVPYLTSFNQTARASDWRALAATCDRYNNRNLGSFAIGVEQNIRSKRSELIDLYNAAAAAAPSANIYVAGYPVFIPGENTATPSCPSLVGLNGQERTWLRTLILMANSVIRDAVANSDSRVRFVDVEQVVESIGSSDGNNHLICAKTATAYWHGALGDQPRHNWFHPKREAHVEMARRLAACIADTNQCDPPKPWMICDGSTANIYGSNGDDELRGLDTAHKDIIVTLGGNDTVNALNGDDVACGGAGDDRLYGMGDNDRLFGDNGRDLLDGGARFDYCDGGFDADRHADCEVRANFP
jgi:GDSL-like Lipase/Acylhydrolase family/RTX calcium-binding nonapeptide repeat (4 copies)